jgi:dipeptidyl aminopeptidase/acylaminoacyl peptidase
LDGTETRVAESAIYTSFQPSPGGDLLLVTRLLEPFSYLVPAGSFAREITVRDLSGNTVKEVARLPAAENVPTGFGSVPTGVRSVQWRSDKDAMLVWVEALDGGDARAESERRDRVFLWDAPFEVEPKPIVDLGRRYAGITWIDDERAVVSESWWSDRTRQMLLVNPSDPSVPTRTLFEWSYEDRYADPGRILTTTNTAGASVAQTLDGGRSILLTGTGASDEGNRPFLSSYVLETGETNELFRSAAPYYEFPVALLENGALITRRESNDEPPNYFRRESVTDSPAALTHFEHPYPDLASISKETISYERADGVSLTAVLYLPDGYAAEDGPLPTLVWAYPREFKSADAASQRSDSPYQFKSVSYWGAIPYVTQGYAVLDNAAMPIVGEQDEEPNDSFREQLVMSADAAIAEGAARGVVDPDRVAIGGHSYGAFMTANLLAHSDLFRAGIARSGAYNRTLTPFGFQSEERTYWEAPDTYNDMSPFMHADKIDEPILLIHGTADNNSGTFPIQSERLYAALKGHGKTARLVMLPAESHGYQARESLLHMMWETSRWLDEHVKQATPRTTVIETPVG